MTTTKRNGPHLARALVAQRVVSDHAASAGAVLEDQDRVALARLQHEPGTPWDLERRTVDLIRAGRELARALGHTARGALILSYISPLHVRKPVDGRVCPEGWTQVTITGHLCPELDGTWWVPNEGRGRPIVHAKHVTWWTGHVRIREEHDTRFGPIVIGVPGDSS